MTDQPLHDEATLAFYDREAGAYLPYLFGPAGFCVIRKPEELPRRLPLLYAQLTRQ